MSVNAWPTKDERRRWWLGYELDGYWSFWSDMILYVFVGGGGGGKGGEGGGGGQVVEGGGQVEEGGVE
jgi:hypothetical protein